MKEIVKVKGIWTITARDADGNIIAQDTWENLVTDEGLNYLLDAGLADGTQIDTWYVGLTGESPSADAADTLASHSGWTEVTAYDGNRKEWTPGSVSGKSVSNSGNAAQFEISTNGTTIGGAFLASAASGTSGKLYAVGAFSGGNIVLNSGSTLDVTATFTTAAA